MSVVVLGIFAADAAFSADRLPHPGETLLGKGFALGPGGKGSNQAVAAAKAGAEATLLTRLGRDAFAGLARDVWVEAGLRAEAIEDAESHTGAAFIFVDAATGENAIIVAPGAAGRISEADVDRWEPAIRAAKVFVTQLEQPLPPARKALALARAAGAATILNPAPARPLDDDLIALCDWLTPNETEAAMLSGRPVETAADAAAAAAALRARGARGVVVTLGAAGALLVDGDGARLVPAFAAGPVVDTTGAGDAFAGAFAAALAEGRAPEAAVRFGCAGAAISVTRRGAAAASPRRAEIEALLAG